MQSAFAMVHSHVKDEEKLLILYNAKLLAIISQFEWLFKN